MISFQRVLNWRARLGQRPWPPSPHLVVCCLLHQWEIRGRRSAAVQPEWWDHHSVQVPVLLQLLSTPHRVEEEKEEESTPPQSLTLKGGWVFTLLVAVGHASSMCVARLPWPWANPGQPFHLPRSSCASVLSLVRRRLPSSRRRNNASKVSAVCPSALQTLPFALAWSCFSHLATRFIIWQASFLYLFKYKQLLIAHNPS